MNLHSHKFFSVLTAYVALLLCAASVHAAVLLDLVDAPNQANTPYQLWFTAVGSETTLTVAGYQLYFDETASQNGVFLNGTGINLLGTTWDFVPALNGSFSSQEPDVNSVNMLIIGATQTYLDSFSQTIATVAGASYSYDFLFSQNVPPSEFVVSVDAVAGIVPEPLSLALFGLGFAALGVARRNKKS